MASEMLLVRQRGLITAAGIASGINGQQHDQGGDAVDPRVGEHGRKRVLVGAPKGSGKVRRAGLDPALQFAVTTAQLQVTACILVGQAAAQLLSNVLSLSVELSDQSDDLLLHVQRSLWAAEWGTVCPR